MTAESKGKLTGWHVLMIVGGAFVVVLTMNITFITLALSSFTGEDVPNAYSRGLAYNDVLSDRAAQRDLGWDLAIETRVADDQILGIHVTLSDREGVRIGGAHVIALVRRPTNEGVDQEIILVETADGTYGGEITLPLSGVWNLRIDASRDAGEHLEFEERLWVE